MVVQMQPPANAARAQTHFIFTGKSGARFLIDSNTGALEGKILRENPHLTARAVPMLGQKNLRARTEDGARERLFVLLQPSPAEAAEVSATILAGEFAKQNLLE